MNSIMKLKSKDALNAMMRARLDLMVREPFFGTLAFQLELVEVQDEKFVNTMAVDGVHLYYHPPFVMSHAHQELVGVVAHEVLHCCYKHMTRRGHRNPTKWNWAGDYVINDDLLKAGFHLPKKRLHDKAYSGLSTEEVYERLPDPPKAYVIGASGAGQAGLSPDADKGECGGVLDAPEGKDGAAKADQEWDANTRMAINVARGQHAGTVPAYLERLIKDLAKPKINWRDILRNYIDGYMTKDYTWQRPNRRHIHKGLILPGYFPDALHHLGWFADVSGSITPNIMKAYGGEVQGALDDGVADHVTTLFFDADIQKVAEYLPGDLIDLNTTGGGGTDFRPMFEWAKEHGDDLSCIVVLTDMYPCSWDLPNPDIPVLWGAYCAEEYLKSLKVPFGDVLHIDSGVY